MNLTLGSLFDGIGAFPRTAQLHGIVTKWASEIEPFPIKVTSKHFPDMKHLGDITKINGAEIEPVDVISFGSPCFPADTLVLTESGYKPIQEISIGESVLTHTGKWQRVLKTGGKIANTIRIKGLGHYGLETTPEHPFYSSTKQRKGFKRDEQGKQHPVTFMTNPEWTEAQFMLGKFWATPINIQSLPISEIKQIPYSHSKIPELNEGFWWFIGYWLGNGWVQDGQRSGRPEGQTCGKILICCNHIKADYVRSKLEKIGLIWTVSKERTATRFCTSNKALMMWMINNFGKYAYGKLLPAWIFTIPQRYRRAVLDGYVNADGWYSPLKEEFSSTTVSKKLGLGIKLLAETLGYSASLHTHAVNPKTKIEGREVNQRDHYGLKWRTLRKRSSNIKDGNYSWGLVRDIKPCRENIPVFNLEVENDNSYVVENIIVHNCQDLSVAGKRAGLEGKRSGLFMEAIRIIREMRLKTNGIYPRFAIWENVPGAFSSNGGNDFRAVLEEIAEAEISIPKSGRWATSGMVRRNGREIAWRVLDAQYWGVPQRRKRIFLVADFRGQCAREILFEQEGLLRDTQESRKTREEVAASSGNGVEATSKLITLGNTTGCLSCGAHPGGLNGQDAYSNQLVIQSQLYDMTHAEEVIRPVEPGLSPTLNARMGTDGNQVPVLMQLRAYGADLSQKAEGIGFREEIATCLVSGAHPGHGSHVVEPIPINDKATRYMGGGSSRNHDGSGNGLGIGKPGDPSPTLTAGDRHAVAQPIAFNGRQNPVSGEIAGALDTCRPQAQCIAYPDPANTLLAKANLSYRGDVDNLVASSEVYGLDCRSGTEHKELCGTLQAKPNGGFSYNCTHPVRIGYRVRRLTPVECLRLMGFPDSWLDIEGASDSAKYKATGNSIANPCPDFIFERLVEVLKKEESTLDH